MENLITVNYDTEQPTVSARELHKALNIQSRFSRWFDNNKELFVEGEDFNKCTSSTVVNNGAVIQLEDYEITVVMAKHLALMSRTEKGKQIRNYLIDLEKAWNTPEQVMARALKLADKKIQSLKQDNATLLNDNRRMIPKEIFADAVSASKTSILIGELAKILKQNGIDMGQNRLFAWMRDNGYLIKRKGSDYNMPTQKSIEKHLFEVKETSITRSDGSISISKTAKVTGKGQIYFINKFKTNDEVIINEGTGR